MGVASEISLLSDAAVAAIAAAAPKWNYTWESTFHTSPTVVANGSSAVTASPLVVAGDDAIFPIAFSLTGSDMTVDETNDVVVSWYLDAAGAFAVGTTTFAQATWAALTPAPEPWPGDNTFWNLSGVGASRVWVPLPPYYKTTHTLGGVAKSMVYTIKMSYATMGV